MVKDSYNCEIGMRGTVDRCRRTLAYRVHFDGQRLRRPTFVRPMFATLADNKPAFGKCTVLAWEALTLNMLEVNCFQTPMVTQPFVSQHKTHMREIGELFPHRCRSNIYSLYDLGTCS